MSPINQSELILRLILAVVLGLALGWERHRVHKPASYKTLILVCLGSALFSILSFLGIADRGYGFNVTQIAAGIVTGIGFLGAGAIIRAGEDVLGLTTAASIWLTAAVGMAVGFGWYLLAIVATVLVVAVLYILEHWEYRSQEKPQ
ncbi:MAG: MgtC/SapB family protein [Candidatus Komeilibacteria bacterium]|nr:MgtC/SapB family protein [Candidatus Komeilibacteria bacterium]